MPRWISDREESLHLTFHEPARRQGKYADDPDTNHTAELDHDQP